MCANTHADESSGARSLHFGLSLYHRSLCTRAAKIQATLRIYAGLPGSSLSDNTISTKLSFVDSYCNSGNFRENSIFANSFKRHICED